MKPIRVAGACLNQTPLAWQDNLIHILDAIALARAANVSLLCLPEMSISGYGCEDAFFSDYVLDHSLTGLQAAAAASKGMVVSLGLPMQVENSLYNVVALLADGEILGFVAKETLAGDGIYYEPRWFKPWPQDIQTTVQVNGVLYPFGDLIFEIDGLRIGFEICEDAWNGVRPAQRHYRHNVDLILNPSASNFAFGKTHIREGLVREASRSYSCAYLYTNLLGNEAGRIIYDGEILIAQNGELLARNERFAFNDVQVLAATIDPGASRRAKKKSASFLAESPLNLVKADFKFPHIELLPGQTLIAPFESKEEEFFRAVTLGLFDYMRKSRSHGFVLSLSGGADSSACAVLASYSLLRAEQALGKSAFAKKLNYLQLDVNLSLSRQLITCVYQATQNSGPATEYSARRLAEALDANYQLWDVQPLLESYHGLAEQSIGRELSWATDDLTLQNIQARVRAPGVWMLANLSGGLLLTTSNRSEAAVGYATMDGDTAGGLAPLGGIDKATLVNWLKWAENALPLPALQYVNSLAPTAELRPADNHQTDEADLMPYWLLDRIEKCAIRDYRSPLETFQMLRGTTAPAPAKQNGHNPPLADDTLKNCIVKFYTLWARNQWKRERYAPSFHLDDENLDPRTWCRFPILSGGYTQELLELKQYVAGLAEPADVEEAAKR